MPTPTNQEAPVIDFIVELASRLLRDHAQYRHLFEHNEKLFLEASTALMGLIYQSLDDMESAFAATMEWWTTATAPQMPTPYELLRDGNVRELQERVVMIFTGVIFSLGAHRIIEYLRRS